jgi:NAD(P)H-hydrate epimerase
MKILSTAQIRELDAFTIKNEPIKSIDLMERASLIFVNWFTQNFAAEDNEIIVFAGTGNNGGDGLAVARLLYFQFYNVKIYRCKIGKNTSQDFEINLKRLPKRKAIPVIELETGSPFPTISNESIIIDAIFGSGLSRPLDGYWKELVEHLNQQNSAIVSVDIPSGLFADQHTSGVSIQADFTLSFELPKLSFLFPENSFRVGDWQFKSIDLDQSFIEKCETPFHYIDLQLVKSIFKKRRKFDHKGTFGHALLILKNLISAFWRMNSY